jgi:sarcosine oxidase subunit alpha
MHERHDALGCAWMDMGEWKRPLYYTGAGHGGMDDGRDAKRRAVEQEYRAVRERAGIIDLSTLGKLDVKGADAPKLLDKVYANRLSDLPVGRARYSIICDDAGIILDDGTISRLAEDHFFITTTTGNLDFVQQWLEWWAAGTGWCVHVTNVTGGFGAVNVAGPQARALLQPLTGCDLRTRAFPYMACRQAEVAGVPCVLLRIGFVGETGWEIHFPAEYGEYLWDALLDAGRPLGVQPFGIETQRVLRLEKKHAIVGVDTDATSNPVAADLAWVAKLDKEDFIGKAALLQLQGRAPRERLVGFRMEGDLVPEDGASIVFDGQPVGRVTSARYSFANGQAVGLAWVPAALAGDGQLQIYVDGRLATAHLVAGAFYDPDGKRLRT